LLTYPQMLVSNHCSPRPNPSAIMWRLNWSATLDLSRWTSIPEFCCACNIICLHQQPALPDYELMYNAANDICLHERTRLSAK